jgi:serine/threonine-protein kinase RsbW
VLEQSLPTASRTFGVSCREVAAIDDWVEAITREWNQGQRTAFRARLCVEELAANVLEHAGATADDEIRITLRHLNDGIGIEFVDTCPPFDPTRIVAPIVNGSIETVSVGGRGLQLVHAFSRDLLYRPQLGLNIVSFRVPSE